MERASSLCELAPTHHLFDTIGRFGDRFVFPYANNGPPEFLETNVCIAIALSVGVDFCAPPFSIVLGPSAVCRTSVPETTIDKHRYFWRREHDVYRSPTSVYETAVQPEA